MVLYDLGLLSALVADGGGTFTKTIFHGCCSGPYWRSALPRPLLALALLAGRDGGVSRAWLEPMVVRDEVAGHYCQMFILVRCIKNRNFCCGSWGHNPKARRHFRRTCALTRRVRFGHSGDLNMTTRRRFFDHMCRSYAAAHCCHCHCHCSLAAHPDKIAKSATLADELSTAFCVIRAASIEEEGAGWRAAGQ